MIFYAISDLHLTSRRPRCRSDNYVGAQFGKLEWILKTVTDSESKTLVIGGDVFDKPNEAYFIIREFLRIVLKYNKLGLRLLTIPGQHDLFYHVKGINNVALGIIQIASILPNNNNNNKFICKGIKFISQGWGEEITGSGDVLVTHTMVIENKELFPGQESYISGKNLLRKHKDFRIIISGDNHQSFTCRTKKQLLVNCGSVTRSNKSQIDFKPKLWEINTKDLSANKLYIPIRKDVFNLDLIEDDDVKKENKELDAFIQSIPIKTNSPNFNSILKDIIKTKKPNKSVQEKINNIMEQANG